jgi:hypothetical protein
MDENAERDFDALHALSEQEWRDWDQRSRHEWRLSFGVWGALLAASAAGVNTDFRPSLCFVIIAGFIVLGLHIWFLIWIQGRLKTFRIEYLRLRAQMPTPVTGAKPDESGRWWKSPSTWTQAGITLLLVAILIFVANSDPSRGKHPSVKSGALQGLTLAAADGPQLQCPG